MNGGTWVLLGVAALLGFWVLGAYNRLVGLRNALAAAWTQADEAQQRRAEGADQLVAALRAPLTAEQGALDALVAAKTVSARAAVAMSSRPLLAANATAWAEAERHLVAAAARVFALAEGAVDHGEAPAGDDAATAFAAARTARAAWDEGDERLRFARQLYNDAAAAHDEAIAAFPTSVLRPAFGFQAAGRI